MVQYLFARNTRLCSLLLFLIMVISSSVLFGQGQHPRRDSLDSFMVEYGMRSLKGFPITRDTLNKFPKVLVIEGTIVDSTLLGFECGAKCGCGTLKIKLTKPHKSYHYPYIYVAVPCMDMVPPAFYQKKVWRIEKIALKDKSCYWTEVPRNKFDTGGLPFYQRKLK